MFNDDLTFTFWNSRHGMVLLKKSFEKGRYGDVGPTNSTVHTLFCKYVDCNVQFLNSSNVIMDTQYHLPNERSLTGSELFYIIC